MSGNKKIPPHPRRSAGRRHGAAVLYPRRSPGQRGADVLSAVRHLPPADLHQHPAGSAGAGRSVYHLRTGAAAAGRCGGCGALISGVRLRQPEPSAAVVQSHLLHLVPHAGLRVPDALAPQGLYAARRRIVAQPAADPAVHCMADRRYRRDAGAGGGGTVRAGVCRTVHHHHRLVHHRVEFPALRAAGGGHGYHAGDPVYALPGPAPPLREVLPGVGGSLAAWMVLSMAFSYYVEHLGATRCCTAPSPR